MRYSNVLYRKRVQRGTSLAEFGPVLFIFLFMIVFPLVNLVAYSAGVATVALITANCAVSAQNANNLAQAMDNVRETAISMLRSPFGRFAKLRSDGGFRGCGMDVYVVATDPISGSIDTYGPNTGVPTSEQNKSGADTKIYEYSLTANYRLYPFLNLSAVPFIGSVPILGKPAKLQYTACRNIEHTGDLTGPTESESGEGEGGDDTGWIEN